MESSPESDNKLAITAEALYLINLMLAPGIAFVILLVLYVKHSRTSSALAQCHLKQTLFASLWAGVLIVLVNAVILLFGGYDQAWTWVVLIIYFITIHATLILLGVLGLSNAIAGKHYHFPFIGVKCHAA